MNHLPLGRRAPTHATAGDTANPHGVIDCPTCRAMLQTKVNAHSNFKGTAKERAFFAADATRWQAVLDRKF